MKSVLLLYAHILYRHTLLLVLSKVLLLCFAHTLYAQSTRPGSMFTIRPQGLSGPRKIAGEIPGDNTHVYVPEKKIWPLYDSFILGNFPEKIFNPKKIQSFLSITSSYQQSFNADAIAQRLFNQSDPILIQGSAVPNRDKQAWLADYLYLPETFNGVFGCSPTIANTIINFNAYVGLDILYPGMYARIYTPFVHTKWSIHESIQSSGGMIPGGRFSPDDIDQSHLLASAAQFFNGTKPAQLIQPGVVGNDPETPITIIRNPLAAGKISNCSTRNGLAEMRGEFGFDFWQREYAHAGIYLAAAAPTGSSVKPEYMFSPTIGNNKQWEFGGGITAHYLFWQSINENHQCGIYLDATITHPFGHIKEYRVFDLKNKPMSRYMLAAKHVALNPPGGINQLSGSPDVFDAFATGEVRTTPFVPPRFIQLNENTPSPYQFANEFTPVANLTAQEIKVNFTAQIDATLWLTYATNNINIDLGYNLWAQTGQKISCAKKTSRLEPNTWALHGNEQVFGYFPTIIGVANSTNQNLINPNFTSHAIAIAASQSDATIYNGTNAPIATTQNPPNAGIDNATDFAFAQTIPQAWPTVPNYPHRWPFPAVPDHEIFFLPPGIYGAPNSPLVDFDNKDVSLNLAEDINLGDALDDISIKLSMDPVFIQESDIAVDLSPQSKAISHTLFANIGYTWDREHVSPYISIGGEVEFGASSNAPCTNACANQALSQWGVWLKLALICN